MIKSFNRYNTNIIVKSERRSCQLTFFGLDSHSKEVMAVDNLPSALPKDASEGFWDMFLEHVIPAFFNDDRNGILQRARITTSERTLTKRFSYLQEYVDGKD